jgi:hypothetical protein
MAARIHAAAILAGGWNIIHANLNFEQRTGRCSDTFRCFRLDPRWAPAFAGVTRSLLRFSGMESACPVHHMIEAEHQLVDTLALVRQFSELAKLCKATADVLDA